MTISSIIPGRLPNGLQSSRLTQQLGDLQSKLARLQSQASTNRRIQLLSDDPTGAIQSLGLQSILERNESLKTGAITNQGYLNATETNLVTVSDSIARARQIAQAGIGDGVSATEKATLADEVGTIIQGVLRASNGSYQGRYLFGGAAGDQAPFSLTQNGIVRYAGDTSQLQTYADRDFLQANNLDGARAFGALSTATGDDINPALTLSTRLADLRGPVPYTADAITVEASNGTPITKTIDLKGAETIQDVKTRIESAFAAEAITVAVVVDPATQSGLRITPSVGTVKVANVVGSQNATALGIAGGPVAQINGASLNPKLTAFTPVAALNGGTGIGPTAGTGLRITNGGKTSVVDLNGAATLGDVINRIQAADPDVYARIDANGDGLQVSTRLSGANFSIGENGGNNATQLGIRTLKPTTTLSSFNLGRGVPVNADQKLVITRRDGTTTTEIDLSGSLTVQDVLTKINAADPGVLTASLNAVGNGISLTDSGGAGALTVNKNELADRLGLTGTENTGATGVLVGTDANPQQANGVFNSLVLLEKALRAGDNVELGRLLPILDGNYEQSTALRGELGARQKLLDDVTNQFEDAKVSINENLSKVLDADLTSTITEIVSLQQTLQATLEISSRTAKLSILDYL